MRPFFQRELTMSMSACVLVIFCLTTETSTWRKDFLIPRWLRHLPNENSTDIPKFVTEMQDKYLFSARLFFQNMFSSQHHRDKSRSLQKTQKLVLKSTKQFCDTNGTRSETRPTSVHRLRPGDVDVIGSVGDSLTVGTGSFSYILPQLAVDHRGVSWSGGGQGTWKEYLTLPNILKVFNPKLIGYAYGDSTAEQWFSQFNVAEVGALSQDMPFMTKELVKRIKMDKRVNINKDWKLITILVGSNTYCLDLCYQDHTKFPARHREEIMTALLYIKEHLPRTMVNLVTSPNLEILIHFTNMPPVCWLTHIVECPCLFATQYKHKLKDFVKIMSEFQEIDTQIVEDERLKDKEDFTVVLQPFMKQLKFPVNQFNHTDLSYLGPDCFHMSQKGYSRAANALWNNMMEPVGKKSLNWSKELERFNCPTSDRPFISTWKNSV